MALQKEIKSKTGATGNYMSVHAISYDNEKKSLAYSVALYLNEKGKREGAEPLEIIYQGKIEKASSNDMIAQCYADMKAKSKETQTISVAPASPDNKLETKKAPAHPDAYRLFNGAENI